MKHRVDLTKARQECVVAALKRHGLAPPGAGSWALARQVSTLVAYYRAHTPRARIADCETCGGESDSGEAACPYCGDADGEASAEVEAVEPVAPVVGGLQVVPAAGSMVAAAEPPSGSTERDLDRAVAKVLRLRRDAASSIWELAVAVREVSESSIWKLRRDETGAPKWTSWGRFAVEELGVSPAYSYQLIEVAKTFTRAEVDEVGIKKLIVSLRVSHHDRGDILAAARAGESVSELEARVETVLDGGEAGGDDGGAGGGGEAGATPRPRLARGVTAAMLMRRVTIPLYRPGSMARARRLADTPRGEERLVNGVKQVFVVDVDSDGGLVLIVERLRET